MKTLNVLPSLLLFYITLVTLKVIYKEELDQKYVYISFSIIFLIFNIILKFINFNKQFRFHQKLFFRTALITILSNQDHALKNLKPFSAFQYLALGYFLFKYTQCKTNSNTLAFIMRIWLLFLAICLFMFNHYLQENNWIHIILIGGISFIFAIPIFKINLKKFSETQLQPEIIVNSYDLMYSPRLGKDQQLEQQLSLFKHLFNQFPHGMMILGENQQIEYHNSYLKSITKGISIQERLSHILSLRNCSEIVQEQSQINELFKILNERWKKKSVKDIKGSSQEEEDKEKDDLLLSSFNIVLDSYISSCETVSQEYEKQMRMVELQMANFSSLYNNQSINAQKQPHQSSIYSSFQVNSEKIKFFYEVKMICKNFIQEDDQYSSIVLSPSMKDKENQEQYFEVILKPYIYDSKPYVLFLIRDVTLFNEYTILHQINENKTKMLFQVSHEFRTPLNCIILLITRLIEKVDSDDIIQEFLQPIQLSANQLLSLANDLLDLAQLKAGKFRLVQEEFQLDLLLINILTMLTTQAHQKNLSLKLLQDQTVPTKIISDPNRLRQIIINLISNSIKFTQTGGIFVELHKDSLHHKQIQVVVRDTGVGIDKEDQKKLFSAFSRIEKTAQMNSQGVGLGLMISHLLAQKLSQGPDSPQGIGLEVESDGKNKGTIFRFCVYDHSKEQLVKLEQPSIKKVLVADGKYQVKRNSSCQQQLLDDGMIVYDFQINDDILKNQSQLQSFSKGAKSEIEMNMKGDLQVSHIFECECFELFIVDDTKFNITALIIGLEKYHLKIDYAESGEIAQKKMLNEYNKNCSNCHGFKIILMDIIMPIQDGFMTCEKLRQLQSNQYPKCEPSYIIGCSGLGEKSKQECLDKGMNDYLEKPIKLSLLIEKLKQIKLRKQKK